VAEVRNRYGMLVGKLGGRDHLEDLGIDGKIMLTWMLKK
jgi:hypothetical protein